MAENNHSDDNSASNIDSGLLSSFENLRLKLLDTSKRNPLTSVKPNAQSTKQIHVVDEISDQIFRMMYHEEKVFSFLPANEAFGIEDSEEEDESGIYVSEEQMAEINAAHTDTKLQTALTTATLQKRLLSLYREAKSIEEDLGVNVLYLALGFLQYYESDSSSQDRFAPLILVPVDLRRDSSKAMFKLAVREDELITNQSLALMLEQEFGLLLPNLPTDDEWLPSSYFNAVRNAVSGKPRWVVNENEMLIRFFSFEKYMMSRELEQETLEQFSGAEKQSIALVNRLLNVSSAGASEKSNSPSLRPENRSLDREFEDPRDLGHILDADTSQTGVISAAMKGSNLVVQGPPGTGKSQTIANMIGTAVAKGKRVLFVAEKKAALDVVYRRLQNLGLGHMCLELHSHKANRKHFYKDLKDTLDPVSIPNIDQSSYDDIRRVRDELNRLTELVHEVDETGNTPFLLMGRISELTGRGIQPGNFSVPEIGEWGKEEFEQRLNVVASFADQVAAIGSIPSHEWRGSSKRLTPLDQTRLRGLLNEFIDLINKTQTTHHRILVDDPITLADSLQRKKLCLQRLQKLANAPSGLEAVLNNPTIEEKLSDVSELVQLIHSTQELEDNLRTEVIDSALEFDWELNQNLFSKHGKSLFRIFNGGYRDAIGRLKSVCKAGVPSGFDERLVLFERLLQANKLRRSIKDQQALGKAVFGVSWLEQSTDVANLVTPLNWITQHGEGLGSFSEIKRLLQVASGNQGGEDLVVELKNSIASWESVWSQIEELLGFQVNEAFPVHSVAEVNDEQLKERVQTWLLNPEGLNQYHQLYSTCNGLNDLGLAEVAYALNDNKLEPSRAVDTVMLLRCEVLWKKAIKKTPELEKMNGQQRTDLVEDFKSHDKRLQVLAAQELVKKHDEQMPRGFNGEIGLLRGEANKKTRHIPIRKALDNAGTALSLIKPIFLMSPMSISRFLSPGKLSFDLLLIDEASQVKPEEAMGAMLRSAQVVVVGDQKQMPPTSFFDKQVSAESLELEEDASLESITESQLGDMESVLSLCEARGFQREMLSWHYRSEHPSLIEVSNHEFYDNKLVFPTPPNFGSGSTGLQLVHAEGVYSRGKGKNNVIEADKVCQGVLEHVTNYPGQSLGIVALSTAQRDTIQNKLDELCGEHPNLDKFCFSENDEPFFVKNLENVQGDERDVIFVSIGYGPDEDGAFFQNLGPVSNDGGERRLNVLFTRSRKRCVIYSSISHDQIREDAARFAGPRILKQFLKYAETGVMDVAKVTGEDMDSPFEEDVARVIRDHGYGVEPQVGSAGFKIDLAIHDPDQEGHFLLAVECDGARYHSSAWARERDRLRQEVLEGKGWRFHRIWSTDWFYSRDTEISKLTEAIERARSHRGDFRQPSNSTQSSTQEFRTTIETSESEQPDASRSLVDTVPYQEASFELPPTIGALEIHEVYANELAKLVQLIVEVEGPIHRNLIAIRLSRLWGKSRTGSRIVKAVDDAISYALNNSLIDCQDDESSFLIDAKSTISGTIRNREQVELAQLKEPENIPKEEISGVIQKIVHASVSIEVTECSRQVGKVLGTNVKRSELEDRVRTVAHSLSLQQHIEMDGTTLSRN